MKTTYRVICHNANRGYTNVIAEDCTQKRAFELMLQKFNAQFEMSCKNWGEAVFATRKKIDSACPTDGEGCRSFYCDGYYYTMQAEYHMYDDDNE